MMRASRELAAQASSGESLSAAALAAHKSAAQSGAVRIVWHANCNLRGEETERQQCLPWSRLFSTLVPLALPPEQLLAACGRGSLFPPLLGTTRSSSGCYQVDGKPQRRCCEDAGAAASAGAAHGG